MGARTIQWLAGSYAAAAALACWRGRLLGGPGALVDLSLAEVANVGGANFMDVFHAIGVGVNAEPSTPPRASRRRRSSAPPTGGSASTPTRRTSSPGSSA